MRDEERDTTFVVRRHDCFHNNIWPTVARAQSESAGVNQYFNNCASCHESTDPGHQAPKTGVLKQMTPEHVLDVLTSGSMRSNAAALSDQDKRLIAEWVGGRKIDADAVGSIEKMTNVCSTHPPVRESNAPAWNGWGADLRNTRSQTAAAAGLSPAQVSRLQLKWAFGFPGATALYSQTVYDGRLYVTSNAGYVYSLDAESGCVHWAFPLTGRRAERLHDRQAQPNQLAARGLLRRYSRHGLRARCKHGLCYLENADGSASAGAYHRHARVI